MSEEKQMKVKAEILLIGVVMIWGYTFPVVKNVLEEIPPFTFLSFRFFLAFNVIYLIFRKRLKKFDFLMVKNGCIIGLFLFLGYFGQTVGTQFTSATKTAFITGISVVMVPIFAFFWIKEKIYLNSLFGVLLATLGLWLMNSNGTFYHFNLGDSLVFLGAIGFALYLIAVDIYTRKMDYIPLVFLQLVTVCLLSFFAAVLFERESLHFSYSLSVWWGVLINGVFATALAFYLQNRFQRYSTPTKMAIIFSAEPVFGAFFSYLLLGERTGLFGFLGGIMILAGIFIAQIEQSDKK